MKVKLSPSRRSDKNHGVLVKVKPSPSRSVKNRHGNEIGTKIHDTNDVVFVFKFPLDNSMIHRIHVQKLCIFIVAFYIVLCYFL